MSKTIARLTAAAATLAVALGVAFTLGTQQPERVDTVVSVVAPEQAAPVAKRVPAPTTVKGYRQMFASVDTAEWGAADVAISQRLNDGRRVWLYGDTFSGNNGFVHSTIITQDGGSLHVSKGGAQVLPNGPKAKGREVIYWIEGVSLFPNGDLRVVAGRISMGTANVWDFYRTGDSRVARVRINDAGDARFIDWTGWTEPIVWNDFASPEPHHFTYGGFTHTIRLANGERLHTVSQNWDDEFSNHVGPNGFRYADFRPLFSSTSIAP